MGHRLLRNATKLTVADYIGLRLLIHEQIPLVGVLWHPRFLVQSMAVFTDLPTGAPDDSAFEGVFSLKLAWAKNLDGTGESSRLVGATDGSGGIVRCLRISTAVVVCGR